MVKREKTLRDSQIGLETMVNSACLGHRASLAQITKGLVQMVNEFIFNDFRISK